MRKIREIIGTEEKVWFYIGSREVWEKFADTAENEGYHFGSLSRNEWVSGYVVSVHNDGEMGHLPLFVWCASFSGNAADCPKKIDFGKYIEGAEDYYCHTSHFMHI